MPTSYPNLAGAYPFLQTCCSVALLPCCSTRDGGSGQVVLGCVFGEWRRNSRREGENGGSITAQSSQCSRVGGTVVELSCARQVQQQQPETGAELF